MTQKVLTQEMLFGKWRATVSVTRSSQEIYEVAPGDRVLVHAGVALAELTA